MGERGGRRPAWRPRRTSAGIVVLAMVVVLTIAGLAIGGRVAAAGSEPALSEREVQLRSLKERIDEKRRQIEALRREGRDLERILAELERERGLTERYLEALAEQEALLEADLAARQTDLVSKEQLIAGLRAELSTALVRFYKQRRVEAAELLVSSLSFGEVFARAHYWGRAVRNLREQLAEVESRSTEIEAELATIQQRRTEMLALKAEREQQLVHLQHEESQRREDRQEIDQTVARYEEQTRKLQASQKQIEALLREAQRSAASPTGDGLAALRGRLAWPVSGPIVVPFGTRVHPRYGTRVEQKGIVISAPEGTPIEAVAAGRVVFEGWLEGYGRTIVLDHGGGYFTLYAHASQNLVTRGALVRAGDPIARVGSSDSLYGPGLHFEIREGATAVDPTTYLR